MINVKKENKTVIVDQGVITNTHTHTHSVAQTHIFKDNTVPEHMHPGHQHDCHTTNL